MENQLQEELRSLLSKYSDRFTAAEINALEKSIERLDEIESLKIVASNNSKEELREQLKLELTKLAFCFLRLLLEPEVLHRICEFLNN